ncbi:MAG: hypothetical protein VCA38_20405 [Roseibacillus sp.]
MNVRLANPDDPDLLLDIWLRSVRATHHFLTEDDIQSLLPQFRDRAPTGRQWWLAGPGRAHRRHPVLNRSRGRTPH